MARRGLDRKTVIERAARLANETGFSALSIKTLADALDVKSPSLYNHIGSLDELKRQLMLYGWRQISEQMIESVAGVSGYDAIREICYAFYGYATENPGVFDAMFWYNKFEDEETKAVTDPLFSILYRITLSLGISRERCNHLIRTLRGFLEGFALLVNNRAFGNPISIRESFELSVHVLIEGMKTLEEKEKRE